MAYTPIVIASIALTTTHRFASRDYYDASNNFYKGTLLNFPDLTEQLPDLYYGVENSQSVTLELANPIDAGPDDNWYTISEAEELRGTWVTLGLYDPDDGTTILLTGKVSKYELAETFKLTVEMRNDPILDTLLPKDLVTVDTFTATAQDIGQPINICFGRCKDVPLRNIQNDTSGEIYDYLIGYGPIEGLYTSLGFGVKREGVLVNPPEYTLYDGTQGSPYPGFAFIRFTTEQTDALGRFYSITADVNGLLLDSIFMERDFPSVIQSILSNSVFGLDDDCDATSFSDAVTILDVYYRCDGAITKQRAARDILKDMLFPARNAYIFRGTDGEWEISVPTTGASVATFGENDGYYNNCKITSISVPDTGQALRKVIIQYDFDMSGAPRATLESQVHSTFGIDKTYAFKFVQQGYTAKKIASYSYQRALYEGTISLECGLEARALRRGDIITVVSNDKPPLTSGKEYIVESVNRIIQVSGNTANLYRVTGREYDADLYGDVELPDKTDFVPGANTVNGPVSLIGDLKLGDGNINPGTITLQVAPGEGDTAIKIGKTDFDNTETGIIMGIDDSDSDAPKIYIGDSSKYWYWDGTDFVINAGNFELDADGNITATSATLSGAITITSGSGISNLTDAADLVTDAAVAAQDDADTALAALSDIAADDKITPVEKLIAKQLWDTIVVEGTATTGTIPVQATAFGVADTDFDTAYAALDTYLNVTLSVFASMITSTTVVRADWDAAWKDYYDERTQILNAIATATATLADWDGVSGAGKPDDNADVTGSNTAADTILVNGLAASTISGWRYGGTTYIDGGDIYAGTVTAYQISANTITAANINGTAFGTLTISSGKIQISTADALEITAGGNIKINGGGDIEMHHGGTPSYIKLIGSSGTSFIYGSQVGDSMVMECDNGEASSFRLYSGASSSWAQLTANDGDYSVILNGSTQAFTQSGGVDLGSTGSFWGDVFCGDIRVGTAGYIQAYANASNYARIHMNTGGEYITFIVNDAGVTGQLYMSKSDFRSTGDKDLDLGGASYAWDDAYADDWNNVADFFLLDDRDDLSFLHKIKGSGVLDPKTGLEIVNDNTLPEFILARSKDGSEIVRDPDGKPYVNIKANESWMWGMIKQLDKKFEAFKREMEG